LTGKEALESQVAWSFQNLWLHSI